MRNGTPRKTCVAPSSVTTGRVILQPRNTRSTPRCLIVIVSRHISRTEHCVRSANPNRMAITILPHQTPKNAENFTPDFNFEITILAVPSSVLQNCENAVPAQSLVIKFRAFLSAGVGTTSTNLKRPWKFDAVHTSIGYIDRLRPVPVPI